MNRTLITSAGAAVLTLAALMALAPSAFAFASTSQTACLASAGTTSLKTASLTQLIQLGNCEIAFRDVSLNAGLTRVSQMSKVSAANQAIISANLNATISDLSAIQTKLDADTTVATARTDRDSIGNSVRVYALVLPQTWIAAGADRAETISASSTVIIQELTVKVNALSATSTQQSTDLVLLADATAKIADATTNANAAVSEVINLVPDKGNQTIIASNAAAIADAHAKMLTVQSDFETMVQDLKGVIQSLKA